MEKFDLVVIGAGPGGYVAAIRSAQLGMKVAVIEKRKGLGGTCLNVGCIPSKALLDSSELYHQAKASFATHGIDVPDVGLNFEQMMKRKEDVVNTTVGGIDYLFKKNGITRFEGLGSFVDANTIHISGEQDLDIQADKVLIATGSEPTELPFLKFDGENIISSTEALSLKEVPKHLIVVGGGVIGLEIGSVYKRLGADVTVVEFLPKIVPSMDEEIGKQLQKSLQKLKVKFKLSHGVTGATVTEDGVLVQAKDKKGKEVEFKGDKVLVAVGRRANTDGLNLDAVGIKTDQRGCIEVSNLRTEVPNIWAIGDVVAGPMLAHKAEEEGVAAIEMMMGQKPHIDYNLIPGVVYTWPEAASVGKTEAQLKEEEIPYKKGMFPFKASGRARAAEESEGLIKVLAHEETDELLGVHMLGPRCADLITEAVVAMEYKASAEDIARICHPHPTYSEAVKEAALAATEDRAIHI